MALILVYLLPVFLASVFIPRFCESSDLVEPYSGNADKDLPGVYKKETKHVDKPSLRHRHQIHSRRRELDKSMTQSFSENTHVDSDTTKEILSEPKPAVGGCPKCFENKKEEKKLKFEAFKQKLLQRLGLSSPPKVEGPLSPLPLDFYVGEEFAVNDGDGNHLQAESKHAVQTKKIFIYGKDITHNCAQKKGAGCYSFDLTNITVDPEQVAKVDLWIYKQPDVNDHHLQTFMVSELESHTKQGKSVLRIRNIVKRIETRLKYGWMRVYVTRSVSRWLSKPHRNQGLAVVCKTCQRQNHKSIYGTKEGYMPILVFYMKQNQQIHKRSKRYTECLEGGSRCCRMQPLVFNFHEQGWDYIMAPTQININYCTGSCNGITAAYHNHTRLVKTLQQGGSDIQPKIQFCCSPVSFGSPQSLLYSDSNGVVRNVEVPDLVVTDCGCT